GDKNEFRIYQGRETAADTGMPDDPDWESDDRPVPEWLRRVAAKIGKEIEYCYQDEFCGIGSVEELLRKADSLRVLEMIGQGLIDIGKRIKNFGADLCELIERGEEPQRLEIQVGSLRAQVRSRTGRPFAFCSTTDPSVAVVVHDPDDPTVQYIGAFR